MPYTEDDMLMLSGIQHIVFCPRQWALIHIEQQWDENKLTAEGMLIHKNVDNPSYRQLNNGVATLHSVHVAQPHWASMEFAMQWSSILQKRGTPAYLIQNTKGGGHLIQ